MEQAAGKCQKRRNCPIMGIFKSELNMLNLKEGKKVWIEKRVK